MFRSFSGFKSYYQDFTLVIVSEFNEWKVLVYRRGVTIHGARQFAEEPAKKHALSITKEYIRGQNPEDCPHVQVPEWEPTSHDDWLVSTG
jgi:hypothetical protein